MHQGLFGRGTIVHLPGDNKLHHLAWQVNFYFQGRLGFYGQNPVPGHTDWHAGGTKYHYIASCALGLYKSMVLWKCTNGADVRGKSCVVGGHNVDRLGTTKKTVQVSISHEYVQSPCTH